MNLHHSVLTSIGTNMLCVYVLSLNEKAKSGACEVQWKIGSDTEIGQVYAIQTLPTKAQHRSPMTRQG